MTTTTPTTREPEPWDRQPRETDKAYEAFRAYLELGPARSTANVARALGKSKTLTDRWCSRWQWVRRAAAWTDQESRTKTDAHMDEIERRTRRQAEIATLHGEALTLPARELLRRLQANPQLLTTMPLEVLMRIEATSARAYKQVMLAERLARGMSTENVAGHDGGPLLPGGRRPQDLSDDEIERMVLGDASEDDPIVAYLQGREDEAKAQEAKTE